MKHEFIAGACFLAALGIIVALYLGVLAFGWGV